MMAGNPNWWSMNIGMHPQSHQHPQLVPNNSTNINTGYSHEYSSSQYPPPPLPPQYNLYGTTTTGPASSTSLADHHPNQDFPRSWSHLLLGGLGNNEHERFGSSPFQIKKLESWEDHILNPSLKVAVLGGTDDDDDDDDDDDVKPEDNINAQTNNLLLYGTTSTVDDHHHHHHEFQASNNNSRPPNCWSTPLVPASSPTSCVTSLSSNLFNFSGSKAQGRRNQHHQENSISECNSSVTGSTVHKKPRIQHSTAQPALKVRKEKLGDRITALHQLVSPFGKTDTASVLSEAIGYIRFLQAQIEALSSPYLGNVAAGGSMGQGQGQGQGHPHCQQQCDVQEQAKDLRSRGLCLVPVSCTQHVGNETGADYWAPALGGGF